MKPNASRLQWIGLGVYLAILVSSTALNVAGLLTSSYWPLAITAPAISLSSVLMILLLRSRDRGGNDASQT